MSNKDRGIRLQNDININANDVPYQMLYGGTHIEVLGNKRISFDVTYKIVEYTTEILKIKKGRGYILIEGINLVISNVQIESFLLTGNIKAIIFE